MRNKEIVVARNQENRIIERKGHVFYYQLSVLTAANQQTFELEQNSPIQHDTVIGVQVRIQDTDRATVNNNALVNDGVFYSSFLTLKQRNAEVFEKIPLELILQATTNGFWYEVNVPGIDMAQSNIFVADLAAVVAGEEFELVFKYVHEIQQLKS